jgi:hypothetical protein
MTRLIKILNKSSFTITLNLRNGLCLRYFQGKSRLISYKKNPGYCVLKEKGKGVAARSLLI